MAAAHFGGLPLFLRSITGAAVGSALAPPWMLGSFWAAPRAARNFEPPLGRSGMYFVMEACPNAKPSYSDASLTIVSTSTLPGLCSADLHLAKECKVARKHLGYTECFGKEGSLSIHLVQKNTDGSKGSWTVWGWGSSCEVVHLIGVCLWGPAPATAAFAFPLRRILLAALRATTGTCPAAVKHCAEAAEPVCHAHCLPTLHTVHQGALSGDPLTYRRPVTGHRPMLQAELDKQTNRQP